MKSDDPADGEPTDGADDRASDNDGVVGDSSADRLIEPVGSEAPPRLRFPVVGVGASAGGLEAYTEFLKACKPDSGIAYVLIQHLSPKHTSIMAELLQKSTAMPVLQVEDGMRVEPDHVYVIRPGFTMTIRNGHLHLGESAAERMHRRPVDDFFRSLAEEQRQRAVCVILSGTGSNGTAGAQTIKAVGGICIAQDPDTAKFPGMPRSLIDSNLADVILPPAEMFDAIARYVAQPYVADPDASAEALARRDRQSLSDIIAVLRTRIRHDFSGYKKPTLVRRIQRRMSLLQTDKMSDYVRSLRQTPSEVTALADDLLIHVTGFFRDPEVWEAFKARVIEPLVAEKVDGSAIRCWVTACSSGEEAYTIGILLSEAAEAAGKRLDIKIFATDTAERSLAQARAGIFPGGIEGEITPPRLARWFDKDDAFYRVKKELRELVVFAPQNVLQDPPFSRLDLCTCRNLLIYIEPEVQRRVLSLLHFGLREGGALLLGNSETITGAEDLFEPVEKKMRIYRRIGLTRHGVMNFPSPHVAVPKRLADEAESVQRPLPRATVARLANAALLDRHTPPAVVIDRGGEVVYFHGQTDPFLGQPRGEPTRELLLLAREDVRGSLRAALHRAMGDGQTTRQRDGTVLVEGERRRVEINVMPLDARTPPAYFLVSFETHVDEPQGSAIPADQLESGAMAEELRRVRDELQSTIEELQSSNEEMKASHEEVTSVNEELQSANEELETSKEELQSLNEELSTVNAQLHAKMDELERTGNDLASLLSSTDIAVVFLDTTFRIRRFTPPARELIELIPADIGRPLKDLAQKFDDPNLAADVAAVLERLIPIEREVPAENGRWFVRRALPYRTADNRIDGVVVTFVDISARKVAEQRQQRQHTLLTIAMDATRAGWVNFDRRSNAVESSETARQLFGFAATPAAASSSEWLARVIPEDRPRLLAEVAAAAEAARDVNVDCRITLPDGVVRHVLATGRVVRDARGAPIGGTGMIFDVTARVDAEAALRASEARLRSALEIETMGVMYLDDAGRLVDANDALLAMIGRDRATFARERPVWRDFTPAEWHGITERALAELTTTGVVAPYEKQIERPDGTRRSVLLAAKRLDDGTAVEFVLDLTDRKQAESRLIAADERFRQLSDSGIVGIAFWNDGGVVIDANEAFLTMVGHRRDEIGAGAMRIETLIPERAQQSARAALGQLRKDGRLDPSEMEFVRADGTRGWGLLGGALLGGTDAGVVLLIDVSDRHHAESDRRTSEERYRTLFDSIDAGYAVVDLLGGDGGAAIDMRFVEANPAFERQTALVGARGRTIREIRGDDVDEAALETLRGVAATGDPARFEQAAMDGSDRIYEVNAFRAGAPEARRLALLFYDITDRKAAEGLLRQSEARLEAINTHARAGLSELTVDGRFKWINDALCEMLGRTRESLLGTSVLDVTYAGDRDATRERLFRLLATGRPESLDKRYLRPDGGVVYANSGLTRLDDADGMPRNLLAVTIDLTDRRRAEEAIRESEQRFRMAAAAAHMGFWDWDVRANAVRWDATFNEMFGLPAGQEAGRADQLTARVHLDDRAPTVALLRQTVDRGVDFQAEIRSLQSDGTFRWIATYGRPVKDEYGHVVRVIGGVIDITERRRIELERVELLNAEQRARGEAEAASRAKDDFLATLSHELRTPLSAILIWSRLLSTQPPNPADTAEGLDAIARSAEAQKRLIDDLLDSARIASGKLRLDLVPTEIGPLVAEAVAAVEPTAEAKGLTIGIDLSADGGVVMVDPGRVRQIVWNLLNNAVKFTPSGGRIDVKLWRREGHLVVRIADTGRGIDAAFLPHVFERFKQAEVGPTRTAGGLGLGLAIVRQLVEMHNGQIEATSEGANRGASFTIELPLPSVRATRRSKSRANGVAPTGRRSLAGVRVLIVEDQPDTRRATRMLLEAAEAIVAEAASSADAETIYAADRPALLISDIGLPGDDGRTLLRRLRAADLAAGLPRVPAVALTAFAKEIDRASIAAAGFDAIVVKPFQPEALLAAVSGALPPVDE